MGVPQGEARFYAEAAAEGHTLVVVNADGRAEEVRKLVLDHGGFDVQSRGAEFIRGNGAGVSSGARPRPVDVTDNWVDFRSRYQMLWQQHYGTTDATWEQMEPLYQYAWQLANDARSRGRPWSQVESSVRRILPIHAVAERRCSGPDARRLGGRRARSPYGCRRR